MSVLYVRAISGTNGSSGFGSQSKEQIESNTFEIVNAGDHYERSISRQIAPFEFIFGWKIFVVNVIFGGLNG